MQACVSGRAKAQCSGSRITGKQSPRLAREREHPLEACKAPGSATDTILIAMSIACGRARWDRSSLLTQYYLRYHNAGSWCHGCHGGETSAKDGVADVGEL